MYYWSVLLNLDGEVGVWPGKISWRDVGPNLLCTEHDVHSMCTSRESCSSYNSLTGLLHTQIVYNILTKFK